MEGHMLSATQLHELVKDVPEVVPDAVLWNLSDREFTYHGEPMDPLHAADLICASAKRMLVKGTEPMYFDSTYFKDGDNEKPWQCQKEAGEGWNSITAGSGPTELEAVLAAYKASKQPTGA